MSGIETLEGFIPHLRVVTSAGVIHAPVKLALTFDARGRTKVDYDTRNVEDKRLPAPMRRDGRLVYALPGGGEVVG